MANKTTLKFPATKIITANAMMFILYESELVYQLVRRMLLYYHITKIPHCC